MSKLSNQICYVLTNNATDIYADINLLSIWSLQQSNPGVHIVLLCDIETITTLRRKNHQIFENVDEVIAVETPSGSREFRNRYIKTSMRRYLKGPFLYLDADTLIRGDLSPIFSTTAAFSAAPNHSGSGDASEIPDTELAPFFKMNWRIPEKYVNGGVLYFSDQPDVYAFAELWHQKWLDCSARTGRHYDQHSLNSALNDSCIDFAWLNHRYNAQVNARPKTAWGAVVWHIYLSDHHASPKTLFDLDLSHLMQNKTGRPEILGILNQQDHPWLVDNLIDRLAVRRIRYGDHILAPRSWERLWLSDSYMDAIKSVIRTFRRRASRIVYPREKCI